MIPYVNRIYFNGEMLIKKIPLKYVSTMSFSSVIEFLWRWVVYKSCKKIVSLCKSKYITDIKMSLQKGDAKFEIFTSPIWGHPIVCEIDSWTFQQMLDLGFSETSQKFHSFQGKKIKIRKFRQFFSIYRINRTVQYLVSVNNS